MKISVKGKQFELVLTEKERVELLEPPETISLDGTVNPPKSTG